MGTQRAAAPRSAIQDPCRAGWPATGIKALWRPVPLLVRSTGVQSGRQPRSENSVGILFGTAAYGLWGLLPLFFVILAPAGAVEIVANRVLWSLLFCALLLTAMRSWRPVIAALRTPSIVGTLALAAVLIAVNWLVYTYGVTSGQAIEASLGYFINPIEIGRAHV